MRHENDGEIVWLYKASGYDRDHPDRYRKPEYVDVASAANVLVGTDGTRVWFPTRSVATSAHWHVYRVGHGDLNDIDDTDAWKIWARVHEKLAVWLGGQGTDDDAILP